MGLNDICAEFAIREVEDFLHCLRDYAEDGEPQAIVERLIELSEKCAVPYPKMSDYKTLVDAVYETHDYLNHGWYHTEETGRMELRGKSVVAISGSMKRASGCQVPVRGAPADGTVTCL